MKREKQGFAPMIALLILVFIISLIPIRTYATDFKYLDNVKVVDGFYRGEAGALQEKHSNKYKVKILPSGKVITVSESDIELRTDGMR